LPGCPGHARANAKNNRLFVKAVLYRYRAGIQWRGLLERFGDFKVIHTRFTHWSKKGVWQKNLKLYVGTNGTKVWYLYYYDSDGKKTSKKLGVTDKLTVAQARMLAQDVGDRVIRGENVKKEKSESKFTYGDFLKNYYETWVVSNRKNGHETRNRKP
jgi:transposase